MAQRRTASWQGSFILGALTALGALLAAPASALAAVTLSGDAATAFDAKVFMDGLDVPTDLVVLPDGRVIVIQKAGDVLTFPVGSMDPVMDHINVSTASEQGLLGIVADPAFATNNYIYVYADTGPDQNNRHEITRYKFGTDNKLGAKTTVVSMGLQAPANHDGGGIDIYKGDLYMSVGDTGANTPTPSNHYASCLNHGNGKVLRVSLAEATFGQPPADNPLMELDMVTGCDTTGSDFKLMAPDKRIWAWGFRNPFRMWIDKTTGKMWIGDVGEGTREEITVAQMGKHHGYPFREGTMDWKQAFATAIGECTGMTPSSECIGPVFDYGHDSGNNCIIGGRILDGCDWPAAFKSRYIFGDNGSGNIWTLDVNATRDGVVDGSQKTFGKGTKITGFRMGSDNALYVLEQAAVTRVTAKGSTATPGSCPAVNAEPGVTPVGGMGAGGAATGGAGGMAAAGAATGGNRPGGGAPGTGGSGTDPGAGAPTGTGGATAGSSTTPTAGTTGNPDGGTNPATNSGSGDSGGCGCHVVGAPSGTALGLGALVAGLGMALGRRRGKQAR